MRKLNPEKRAMILHGLTEGMGVNAVARLCHVDKKTVLRLLSDVGALCRDIHDLHVRDLKNVTRLECDEAWAFIGCKAKSKERGKKGHGDVWVWVGIDPVSKLVIGWYVGKRDGYAATDFLWDIADRVEGKIQITTDAFGAYPAAIRSAFGENVDYAVLQKLYGLPEEVEKRYSPSVCIGVRSEVVCGCPNEDHVSTSIVERQNLSLRMSNRRYTRLTNSFSRKFANHVHAIALHYVAYNFIKRHKSLKGKTPAMAAGIADRPWTADDLATMLESEERLRGKGGRINRADKK